MAMFNRPAGSDVAGGRRPVGGFLSRLRDLFQSRRQSRRQGGAPQPRQASGVRTSPAMPPPPTGGGGDFAYAGGTPGFYSPGGGGYNPPGGMISNPFGPPGVESGGGGIIQPRPAQPAAPQQSTAEWVMNGGYDNLRPGMLGGAMAETRPQPQEDAEAAHYRRRYERQQGISQPTAQPTGTATRGSPRGPTTPTSSRPAAGAGSSTRSQPSIGDAAQYDPFQPAPGHVGGFSAPRPYGQLRSNVRSQFMSHYNPFG